MFHSGISWLICIACTTPLVEASTAQATRGQELDFARDVRPILSDNCFACHGPDEGVREAGLRLDTPRGLAQVVAAEDLLNSKLWQRINAPNPSELMPPQNSGKRLSPEQITVLGRWIQQGAQHTEHWAFVAPVAPSLPQVEDESWTRQELDYFVLEALEQSGRAPGPEASPAILARRASLALTGLPLTSQELDEYLADDRPSAYEQLVDRLIDSPRYGEHMARYWLDAARYADTHGLHLDNRRDMWPWRDHVVQAINADQPFDQFTIEMLAGDLLPGASAGQVIASGFNRNHPTSAEGGMIAAEYRTIYAKDRTDTAGTIWLGLTVGCAKCHDHKYDPISAKEYYGLYAFFDDLGDEASDQNIANPKPFVRTPSAEQSKQLARFEGEIAEVEQSLAAHVTEFHAAEANWAAGIKRALAHRWQVLAPDSATSHEGTLLSVKGDGSVHASGPTPVKDTYVITAHTDAQRSSALRLEALNGDGSGGIPGRANNDNFVLSEVSIEAWPTGHPQETTTVLLHHAAASYSQPRWPVMDTIDGDPLTGWGGLGLDGDRSAAFFFQDPIGWKDGTTFRVQLEFESVHAAHLLRALRLSVSSDEVFLPAQDGPWSLAGPFAIGHRNESKPRFDLDSLPSDPLWVQLNDSKNDESVPLPGEPGVYWLRRQVSAPTPGTADVALSDDDSVHLWVNGALTYPVSADPRAKETPGHAELALRQGPNEIVLAFAASPGTTHFSFAVSHRGDSLDASGDQRGLSHGTGLALTGSGNDPDAAQAAAIQRQYRSRHVPAWQSDKDRLDKLIAERDTFLARVPTTLVSSAGSESTVTRVLLRGQYDAPGDVVKAGTPAALPPFPKDAVRNRLGLARWLVDPGHPLTARVTVNRHWQRFFGTGLVKTAGDFGNQGEWPSNKDLLDHLATNLIADGWSLKNLHRRIATSATFRQASQVDARTLEFDPGNRLLTRGPRFRMDAEVVRDQALSLSGLLVESVGGAPGHPYQPDGIWFAVGYSTSNTVRFTQDEGDANWRRSLYTFWKRTAPPPNLAIFDAPSRELCVVRRERTNTPMQALALLNDRQFVEMSRAFGARILREGGRSDTERATWAFRCATARPPEPQELDDLLGFLDDARKHFANDPAGANALRSVGDAPIDLEWPAVEHGAFTLLANLILNLDETITLH